MSQGNSLSQARRARAAPTEEPENSLAPARRRAKTPGSSEVKAESERPSRRSKPVPVPEEVRKRFVQIKNAYFFADGAKAFTDRGDRLTTPSENTEVVRSLVAIAQARGWGEVVVRGTERFRRDAWAAAQAAGLEVRGYKPTQFEQSRLASKAAARGAQSQHGEAMPERAEGLSLAPARGAGARSAAPMTGILVEHGRAPYQHDAAQPVSYYVKVQTQKGERTLWGVDLERAFKESLSQPKPGDAVSLRAIRQDPVTIRSPERDAEGRVIGQADLATHRNRWVVETRAFLDARAEAARTLLDPSIDPKKGSRRHPELAGTYLQVRAAEEAAKKIRDPQDQKRFVAKVREALAASVARGEPLPPVRLREPRTPEPTMRTSRSLELAQARI